MPVLRNVLTIAAGAAAPAQKLRAARACAAGTSRPARRLIMAIRSLLAALTAAAALSVAEAAAQAETECVSFESVTHELGELALLADACFRAGRYADA